jgi:SPP1 gp7 family putative phage head morphogenesis protein
VGLFSRKKKGEFKAGGPPSMAELLETASQEIDSLIAQDEGWFHGLPYKGAMSRDQARKFEIEKRALWRRIIAEAEARDELKGLRWTTRGDDLVCPECQALEGRIFSRVELSELAALSMHIGCRCELSPER